MQLVEPIETPTIPRHNGTIEYAIDREELLRLKEMGLISAKLYVYLALKLTYTKSNPSVDIEFFCEQWSLTEADFSTALAQLQKKKVLQPTARQLELELI